MATQPLNERPHGDRRCPECGIQVQPGGRGLGRTFCCKEHRLAFNARWKGRGAVLGPLQAAQNETRHAKPGTREAAVCSFARSELTQAATLFNEEDEEAGRPPAWLYIEAVMLSGTRYIDRRRG
jgi:endogenous inhibitor of DNA gyrase (YacG/DUF329 family)